MDAAAESSSFIKQSNPPRLIIKFSGRSTNQQQQQCSKEEEEETKNNMSVSKHNHSNNSTKSISNNSDSSLSPVTCSICDKSFPSKQSLFGHMKSHPEREWRGIQPPPPSSSSPPLSMKLLLKNSPSPVSTDSDDSRKSAECSYKGVGPLPVNWSATGKRRRRFCYASFLASDERLVDAVKGLLMLKEGNDLDAALKNKQIISRETEDTIKKKKKKKRVILESSSSEDVSRSTDLFRSSKKIKIDQGRSCSSSRDGFGPKLISNIQSSQLEQLPPAASSMFQEEDCGLMKNDSKKVIKISDERISCGSSRDGFDTKLMNRHLEQLPAINGLHGDNSRLVKKTSPKKVMLDERGCGSRDGFDPKLMNNIPSRNHVEQQMPRSHYMEQMYSNGGFSLGKNSEKLKIDERSGCGSGSRNGFDSKLINNIPSTNHVEHMLPNEYFQRMFNSVYSKPASLMKATPNKKKVKEIERGSSSDISLLQGSCSSNEFKCDTCNRTFPSHQALGGHKSSQRNCKNGNSNNLQFPTIPYEHHQYQYFQCRESMFQAAEQEYITKTPTMTMSYVGSGIHICEVCGIKFGTGQALGGHKRRHYKCPEGGGLSTSCSVPVNSTTAMAQTDKLIKKEEMNRLSVEAVASSVQEVISSTTKTENKTPVFDFDLNEMPEESPDGPWI